MFWERGSVVFHPSVTFPSMIDLEQTQKREKLKEPHPGRNPSVGKVAPVVAPLEPIEYQACNQAARDHSERTDHGHGGTKLSEPFFGVKPHNRGKVAGAI